MSEFYAYDSDSSIMDLDTSFNTYTTENDEYQYNYTNFNQPTKYSNKSNEIQTNQYWYENMHKVDVYTSNNSHCWCFREFQKKN